MEHFIFGDRITLAQLEIFFEFLRKHRDVRVSIMEHTYPTVSDLIPELIAEAVRKK